MRVETIRAWSLPFNADAGRIKGGQPITSTGMIPVEINLTPDGKKIAYTADRPGSRKSELWEKSLEDGREKLLATRTQSTRNFCSPSWSRDGARIAYQVCDPDTQKNGPQILTKPAGAVTSRLLLRGQPILLRTGPLTGNGFSRPLTANPRAGMAHSAFIH